MNDLEKKQVNDKTEQKADYAEYLIMLYFPLLISDGKKKVTG